MKLLPSRSVSLLAAAALVLGLSPLLATAATAVVPAAQAASGSSVLPAPRGLTAVRVPGAPLDFVVSWHPVAGVAHYNVSVYYDHVDHVTVVAGATTTLDVAGVDQRTTYRITVGSRDASGHGATTGYVWVYPGVPGAPTAFTTVRSIGHNTVTATWHAPLHSGYGPMLGYHATLTRLIDHVVIATRATTSLTASWGSLVDARQYIVTVSGYNALGGGFTVSSVIGNDRPGTPANLVVARSVADPHLATFTWGTPAYEGYSAVTSYQVFWGTTTLAHVLSTSAHLLTVSLPVTSAGVVKVRAVNKYGPGTLTTLRAIARPGTPTTDDKVGTTTAPTVTVTNVDGIVSVTLSTAIGSTVTYPRIVVRIEPTIANGGFADEQWGQNGAQLMTFQIVPRGSYTVTVTGDGDSGQAEFARKFINVGEDGMLGAKDWEVVNGKAVISGSIVDFPYATAENRALSTVVRTSQDLVLSTTATLQQGPGYGVWFRTSMSAGQVNGFSFQYDPGVGNKFILRHWYKNAECGTPLASVAFQPGYNIYTTHHIVVVAKGDAMWVTVDGNRVFDVPSLTALVATSVCGYPMPTGTRIGFRTWGTTMVSFVGTTLS